MKKITALILALLMLLALASCGDGKAETTGTEASTESTGGETTATTAQSTEPTPTEVTISVAELEEKIHNAIGEGYIPVKDIGEKFLTSYKLDGTMVEEYAAKQGTITAVQMDTVVILKVKEDYLEAAIDAINAMYAGKVKYTRLYPFAEAKVLNARLYQSGNYIGYILAGADLEAEASAEEMAAHAIAEYEKIDAVWEEVFGSIPENQIVIPEAEEGGQGGTGGGGFIGGGLLGG